MRQASPRAAKCHLYGGSVSGQDLALRAEATVRFAGFPSSRSTRMFYKREVKKKSFSRGWNFSTFPAHLFEQDLFWPSAPRARLLDVLAQRFGFSLPAVFIACCATKPVSSETSKAERWSSWRPWFYLGLVGP